METMDNNICVHDLQVSLFPRVPINTSLVAVEWEAWCPRG